MASTVAGILLTGTHASRPSSGVAVGTLYSCTTHSLVYQTSDTGSTWATWASLTGTGLSDPMTTRGDIIVRNSSNTTARLAIGSAGSVLMGGTDVAYGTAPFVTAHGCRAKRASTDFSIGTNTLTPVQFDAEDYDTDTIHDNSTNTTRLVIPTISGVTTGLWSIKANGYTDYDGTATSVDVEFRVNAAGNPASGTPIGFARCRSNGGSIGAYLLAVDWVFTAADYVECFVRATGSAGSQKIYYEAGFSPVFEIAFLGKVT